MRNRLPPLPPCPISLGSTLLLTLTLGLPALPAAQEGSATPPAKAPEQAADQNEDVPLVTYNPLPQMQDEIENLVVIGRSVVEGSTASSLAQQQDATAVIEIIGSQEFARMGNSTAADTLQRLTGLNVEEGKFVVIRGQPMRYTSTLFNGSQMPSLDPIQAITPLDLFPSGVLSNISVQKAYTADRPGSFGSGQIQLSTSGLPGSDFLELKAGGSVNFQSIDEAPLEFATGGDRWGSVASILHLPAAIAAIQDAGTPIATLPASERNALTQSFSDELAPGYMDTAGPDGSFSLTGGKRFDTEIGTFGASLAFDYGQNVRTESEQRRVIQAAGAGDVRVRDESVIDRTRFNTGFGGLLALTAEFDRHELKSNTFFVRDSNEQTELNEGIFRPSDEDYLRKFTLEFEQRQLFVQQLTGRHDFEVIEIGWRGLLARADRAFPDRRAFELKNTQLDGAGLWFVNNVPLDRRWNDVDEDTLSGGIDATLPVTALWFPEAAIGVKLQAGFDHEERDRVSETRLFQFVANPADGIRFRPIEQLFSDTRVAAGEVTMSENASADDYTAAVRIDGGYLQFDIERLDLFRLVAGLRFEDARFDVRTFQFAGGAGATPVDSGFSRDKLLPTVQGSWMLREDMQLRAGFGRSLSYPTPVEISDTTYVDPDSSELFLGNPALGPVVIDSYDLRWEWYPSSTEALTIGLFYKDLADPIERFSINRSGSSEPVISFANAARGEILGVELNGRIEFERLRSWFGGPELLDDMYFGGNFSYLDSEVTMPAGVIDTNPVRRMTGQPELTATLELGYTGDEHVIRLAFGYTGDRLLNAGVNGLPDEYQSSRLTLGGKWSYNPNFLDRLTVSLELENALNDPYRRTRGSIVTRDYTSGIALGLSVKWRFD